MRNTTTTDATRSRTSIARPRKTPARNQPLGDDLSAHTYAANRRSVVSAYVFTVEYHSMPTDVVANSKTAISASRRDDQRRETYRYTMHPSAIARTTDSPRRT